MSLDKIVIGENISEMFYLLAREYKNSSKEKKRYASLMIGAYSLAVAAENKYLCKKCEDEFPGLRKIIRAVERGVVIIDFAELISELMIKLTDDNLIREVLR